MVGKYEYIYKYEYTYRCYKYYVYSHFRQSSCIMLCYKMPSGLFLLTNFYDTTTYNILVHFNI